MATTELTAAQQAVIDYLISFNPDSSPLSPSDKLQLSEGLRTALSDVSVKGSGSVLLLYSGPLGPVGDTVLSSTAVAEPIGAQHLGEVRTVGQTEMGKLLWGNLEFRDALLRAAGGDADLVNYIRSGSYVDGTRVTPGLDDWVSERFVTQNLAEVSEVRTLAPFARPDRVMSQTELVAAMESGGGKPINGVASDILVSLRDHLVTQGKTPVEAMEIVRNSLAEVSFVQTGELSVAQGADGRLLVDTSKYFAETPGVQGQALPPEAVGRISLADPIAANATPEQLGALRNGGAALEDLAYLKTLGMASKGLGVLGAGLAGVDLYYTAKEADAAYAAGNATRARELIENWAARFSGGLAGGLLASELMATALAPLFLAGPGGALLAGGLTLAAGLVGGMAGAMGAEAFLEDMRNMFEDAEATRSPLILDLDGDGVETVAMDAGVHFDHNANRFAELTGWVGKDDGVLVRDKNGNGQIDDGGELFGNNTVRANGQLAANGFAALADFDANQDGSVDAAESASAGLRIWKDVDQDGLVDAGELLSFEQASVARLATGFTQSSMLDAQGNSHALIGTYATTSGAVRALEDVWFAADTARTVDKDVVVVPASIASLPDIRGFGNVHSLHQAMARDASGHLQSLVEQFLAESDAVAREAIATRLIYAWTGVEDVDPDSRASSMIYGNAIGDARKLASLEALLGESYVGTWCWGTPDPNPHGPAAQVLLQAFTKLVDYVSTRLTAVSVSDLYNSVGLAWNAATGSLELDLSPVVSVLRTRYPSDREGVLADLRGFYADLKSVPGGAALAEQLRALGDPNGNALAVQLAALGYANVLLGDDADNVLVGAASKDDRIYGGAGNDSISDPGGSDTIEGGGGDDVIADAGGGNNVLRGGEGNDTITFSYYANNSIEGGTGNDLIKVDGYSSNSGNYANTFAGGSGNDRMQSGGSADTYLFGRGDGQDTISDTDNFNWQKTDKVVFGAGIAAGDLFASRSGYNLVVKINDPADAGAGDQITIESWFSGDYYRIESFVFADGTSLSKAQLQQMGNVLYGTPGADSLSGWSDDSRIVGQDGNDSISDPGGSDTIEGGGGDDVIADAGGGNNVLRGGEGNDTITFSYYANNSIEGGTGNDLIKVDGYSSNSGNYANTFAGGSGNDRMQSGGSADTYLFGRGDGQDTISDTDNFNWQKTDKVVFGAGIAAGDLFASRSGYNLVVKINDPADAGAGDQITIESWFSGDYYRIESFVFADGTSLSKAQLQQMGNVLYGTPGADSLSGWSDDSRIVGQDGNDSISDPGGSDTIEGGGGDDLIADAGGGNNVLRGGEGNDTITFSYYANNSIEGGTGNDLIKVDGYSSNSGYYANTFAGGSGNDRMQSGGSADTYLFGRGDGQDTISDTDNFNWQKTDKVVFGAGIAAGDLFASRSGYNLVVKINDPADAGAGDQLTIESWFSGDYYRIESFVFADGTSLSKAQLQQMGNVLYGTPGADSLSGWSDDSRIVGQDGNDSISDPGGSDTIEGGGGDDVIADAGGGSNVLRGGEGNDTITFSYYASNSIEGGTGNDLIKVDGYSSNSGNYANTFAGGSGNDRMQSGGSADTYLFGRGDGQDTISDTDNFNWQKTDKVVFGAGIAAGDLFASRSGYNLVVKINDPADAGAGDQITIESWFSGDYYRIESFVFADGTSLSKAQLQQMGNVLYGTPGADSLSGWSDDSRIVGQDGNDSISDPGGSDTIEGGGGDDVIADAGGGNNVLRGGEGNDTITFSYYANNSIEGGTGNDLIKVDSYSSNSGYYANTFVGGSGNDRMQSGGSADTYLFGRGDGQDTISDTDSFNWQKTDKVVFGAGIAAGDLFASRSGYNLVVKINDPADAGAGDQLTIESWFSGDYYRIESFVFADGTSLSKAQLQQMGNVLYGSAGADNLSGWSDDSRILGLEGNDSISDPGGSDTIEGGGGDDLISDAGGGNNVLRGGEGSDTITFSYYANNSIEGGTGNDLIKVDSYSSNSGYYANTFAGGAGNDRMQSGGSADTYLFGHGDGQDTISDADSFNWQKTDKVVFGADVRADQLWLRRAANNLEISIIGTSDKVTIENWYSGQGYHVEQFKSDDGKTLLDTRVENLVAAMAAFAPPAPGQTSLPQDYRDALAPALAANWQ